MPVVTEYPNCDCCGEGTVETGCCENLLPATLYGTWTGGEACLDGTTWTFNLDPMQSDPTWQSVEDSNVCAPNNCGNYLVLICLSDTWRLQSPTSGEGCCYSVPGDAPSSVNCNPFVITFTVNLSGGSDPCGTGTATLTITL